MFGPGDDSTDRPDELKEQIDGVVCWWEIFMCQIFGFLFGVVRGKWGEVKYSICRGIYILYITEPIDAVEFRDFNLSPSFQVSVRAPISHKYIEHENQFSLQ